MRVLLADDHGIVRRGMKALLDLGPGVQIAGEAADGSECLRLCETLEPASPSWTSRCPAATVSR
jgi:DNA-binding NarL/FixJ family response regulator